MTARSALAAFLLAVAHPSTGDAGPAVAGEASATGFGYITSARDSDPDALAHTTIRARKEAPLGPLWLRATVGAEWWSGEEGGPLVLDPADREIRRSPLSLRELELRLALSPSLDLEAGRFLLGWGKTDGYSPADAFLPRDLTDPFSDEKLALWGLRLRGQRGALRFDAVATALTTPWRLPVLSGRYAPLPTTGFYLTDGESDPPGTGFVALRGLATAGSWDLGAWVRTGVRPAPLLVFRSDDAVPDAQGELAIPTDRHYAHETGFGIELSRVLGPWILRAELGRLRSNAADLGDAVLVTAGIERAFGDATLLLTYASNLEETPVDPALLFDRAFLPGLIVAWSVARDWGSWRLGYTHAFRHGDGLVEAEASYNLDDHWALATGIDWPRGSRKGPLGALRDARRGWSTLRYRW